MVARPLVGWGDRSLGLASPRFGVACERARDLLERIADPRVNLSKVNFVSAGGRAFAGSSCWTICRASGKEEEVYMDSGGGGNSVVLLYRGG
jgi:hypothetical protein